MNLCTERRKRTNRLETKQSLNSLLAAATLEIRWYNIFAQKLVSYNVYCITAFKQGERKETR